MIAECEMFLRFPFRLPSTKPREFEKCVRARIIIIETDRHVRNRLPVSRMVNANGKFSVTTDRVTRRRESVREKRDISEICFATCSRSRPSLFYRSMYKSLPPSLMIVSRAQNGSRGGSRLFALVSQADPRLTPPMFAIVRSAGNPVSRRLINARLALLLVRLEVSGRANAPG